MTTPSPLVGFIVIFLPVLVLICCALGLSLPLFTYQCNVIGNYRFYAYNVQPSIGPAVSYDSPNLHRLWPLVFTNRKVFSANLGSNSAALIFSFFAILFAIPWSWRAFHKALCGLIPCVVIMFILLLDSAVIVNVSDLMNFELMGGEVCSIYGGSVKVEGGLIVQYIGMGLSCLCCLAISVPYWSTTRKRRQDIKRITISAMAKQAALEMA